MNAGKSSDFLKDILGDDEFMPVEEKDRGDIGIIKMLCEHLNGSAVIFQLSNINIISHVSIMGHYIGTLALVEKIVIHDSKTIMMSLLDVTDIKCIIE